MPRPPRAIFRLSTALTSALILSACAAALDEPPAPVPAAASAARPAPVPTAAAPRALAGTQWELVSVHSMSDNQRTTRVADPSRYTMQFGADGSVAFRLDCNRARGAWRASPDDSGHAGRIEFGPLAGTRALCAPGAIDDRVRRDLADVRSYRFDNGQLHLSLMADGGVYRWRPAAW
ncbi:MAG: META domain-containing protein [Rubrivivax sp.]